MNFGKERRRKLSVCEATTPALVAEPHSFQGSSTRRSAFQQSKRTSRDRDFFAPEEVEEWVLPEYRSLFHHLFLKDDEDMEGPSDNGINTQDPTCPITTARNIASISARRRKISPTGSTASSTATDDEGPLCNLVKSLPSWLKKVFHINDDQQANTEVIDRHVWLDEIPIEICDKLRHIHIYV